jgi:hypothetical protein
MLEDHRIKINSYTPKKKEKKWKYSDFIEQNELLFSKTIWRNLLNWTFYIQLQNAKISRMNPKIEVSYHEASTLTDQRHGTHCL